MLVVGIASKVANIADVLRSTHGIAVVAPDGLVYTRLLEFSTRRHAQLTIHGESVAPDGGLASPLVLEVFAFHLFVQSIALHLDLE